MQEEISLKKLIFDAAKNMGVETHNTPALRGRVKQKELAQLCGVTEKAISKILSNTEGNLNGPNLLKVLNSLNLINWDALKDNPAIRMAERFLEKSEKKIDEKGKAKLIKAFSKEYEKKLSEIEKEYEEKISEIEEEIVVNSVDSFIIELLATE